MSTGSIFFFYGTRFSSSVFCFWGDVINGSTIFYIHLIVTNRNCLEQLQYIYFFFIWFSFSCWTKIFLVFWCWYFFGYSWGSKTGLFLVPKNGVRKRTKSRGQRPVTDCACLTFVPSLFVMFWLLFWSCFVTESGTQVWTGNQWLG